MAIAWFSHLIELLPLSQYLRRDWLRYCMSHPACYVGPNPSPQAKQSTSWFQIVSVSFWHSPCCFLHLLSWPASSLLCIYVVYWIMSISGSNPRAGTVEPAQRNQITLWWMEAYTCRTPLSSNRIVSICQSNFGKSDLVWFQWDYLVNTCFNNLVKVALIIRV